MRFVRGALHGLGELCITLGVVLLLFVAWQLWWTDVASGRAQQQLTQQIERSWTDSAVPRRAAPAGSGAAAQPAVQLVKGQPFALIRIPRFGRDYVRPVLEGIDLDILDEGVGHYPSSAGPGAVGNFALAGHRVTYAKPFNLIAELRPGDAIVIETRTTYYVYRVQRYTIVTPDRVDVVAPVPEQPGAKPTKRLMTMTACHPMYSARLRYVVYSELKETIAKAPGVVPDALR